MLIYNTTFHLDGESLISPYLTFMKEYYLPSVTARGYLTNPRFVRLLGDCGEGIIGYALMCDVEGEAAALKKWRHEIGDVLLSSLYDRFGTSITAFSTAMKVVNY